VARVEDQPLHRVQIGVKARQSPRRGLIEALRARHDARSRQHADAFFFEGGQIARDLFDKLRLSSKLFAADVPTLSGMALRAERPKRLRRIERQGLDESLGGVGLLVGRTVDERSRPGLAERRVSVPNELFGVAKARAHRSAGPTPNDIPSPFGRLGRNGRDDERAEARPKAVFVDTEANRRRGVHGRAPPHTSPRGRRQTPYRLTTAFGVFNVLGPRGPMRTLTGPADDDSRTIVNKATLKKFRTLLTDKRDEILKKAKQTLEEDMALDTDDLPDEMDLASSEYLQSFTFRLRGREKSFLDKIEKALRKIDEGTFGVCEECGEEISVKRLEARPETTLCIRCKEDQERMEKDYS